MLEDVNVGPVEETVVLVLKAVRGLSVLELLDHLIDGLELLSLVIELNSFVA